MVTLDIEDASIKMMVVKGRRVDTAINLPLEPGLVHDGVIIDTATVSRRIAELLSAQGINEKKVAVSISGIHAIYRPVPIPKLPKNLLDEAARREAERVMPVSLNELYTAWQAIPISDIETTLCIVGVPRSTVDAMLNTLRQIGLQPEFMDVRPLALARVADERNALIINIEQAGFDIVVMIDGIPEILRSLSFPASAISIPDKIAEVKGELERTVAFHNSSHKESLINNNTATFVSGELGNMLAGTLEYRVKPLPQLLVYADSLNIGDYATNIGLALKPMRADSRQTRVNINVTPEVYQPKALPIIQIVSWAFILVGIAVILWLAVLTLQSVRQTQLFQAQVDNAQTQLQLRQGSEAILKQIQKEIDDAKKAGDIFKPPLDSARAQRATTNAFLSKATSLSPGIIQLQSISYSMSTTKDVTGSILTIIGMSPDEMTIVNYVRDLTNSGQFSEVLITNMSELELNEWQFTLTLK
jgi:hypothetical protein